MLPGTPGFSGRSIADDHYGWSGRSRVAKASAERHRRRPWGRCPAPHSAVGRPVTSRNQLGNYAELKAPPMGNCMNAHVFTQRVQLWAAQRPTADCAPSFSEAAQCGAQPPDDPCAVTGAGVRPTTAQRPMDPVLGVQHARPAPTPAAQCQLGRVAHRVLRNAYRSTVSGRYAFCGACQKRVTGGWSGTAKTRAST